MKSIYSKLAVMLIGISILSSVIITTPSMRSRLVMSTATWVESFRAVGSEEGLYLELIDPSSGKLEGLAWFPKMLLFNAYGISLESLNIDTEGRADMSIFYTFGDFDGGRSLIYDLDSPYNSSFYGAYIIKLKPENHSVDVAELNKLTEEVVRYDYTWLILTQLGLNIKEANFEPEVDGISTGVTAFGSDSWTKVDAKIKTRSVTHNLNGFKRHYLQFGSPGIDETDSEFPPIILFGRTYSKYFKNEDIYVVFYIQSADLDLLDKTDLFLLSESKVVVK